MVGVLAPTGWALVGTVLVILGVVPMIIASKLPTPLVSIIAAPISWIMITLGGYFMMYGLFPAQATTVFGITAVIIYATAVAIILYNMKRLAGGG
jgi:hypothetical protein